MFAVDFYYREFFATLDKQEGYETAAFTMGLQPFFIFFILILLSNFIVRQGKRAMFLMLSCLLLFIGFASFFFVHRIFAIFMLSLGMALAVNVGWPTTNFLVSKEYSVLS